MHRFTGAGNRRVRSSTKGANYAAGETECGCSMGCVGADKTQCISSVGCMGSGRPSRGVYHPRSGRGVFTEVLDEKYSQETSLAIELSRKVVDDEFSWALLESKRQALDEEMIAEALAWSYEHPEVVQSKSVSEQTFNATLLTQQRAIMAKFNRSSTHNVDIGEEALRLPVGMKSACLPGDKGRPRKVTSIRYKGSLDWFEREWTHIIGPKRYIDFMAFFSVWSSTDTLDRI